MNEKRNLNCHHTACWTAMSGANVSTMYVPSWAHPALLSSGKYLFWGAAVSGSGQSSFFLTAKVPKTYPKHAPGGDWPFACLNEGGLVGLKAIEAQPVAQQLQKMPLAMPDPPPWLSPKNSQVPICTLLKGMVFPPCYSAVDSKAPFPTSLP